MGCRSRRRGGKLVRSAETRERLASQVAEPIGSSPADFADSIVKEVAQWTRIAGLIGLRN